MTFAVTSCLARGVEYDEGLTKRFKQYFLLGWTAANTDVNMDLGNYSGTFWTAAGGAGIGAAALKTIKSIQTAAKSFWDAKSEKLVPLAKVAATEAVVQYLDSTATAGGSATETLTFTGLPASAVVLSIQHVSGGTATVGVTGWGAVSADTVANVQFTANPGAGAVMRIAYLAVDATPNAGQYQIAMDGTNTHLPNILWNSGTAPTSGLLLLEWDLQDNFQPIMYE